MPLSALPGRPGCARAGKRPRGPQALRVCPARS